MIDPLDTFEETHRVVAEDIRKERLRQIELWGDQRHHVGIWMTILGEEYGESCQEALNLNFGNDHEKHLSNLREELVQVAAVAAQIAEKIDEQMIEYGQE